MDEKNVGLDALREDAQKLLEDIKTLADTTKEDVGKKIEEVKADLDAKLKVAEEKVKEMRASGGAASVELREGLDKALDALKESFRAAKEKFEEHE